MFLFLNCNVEEDYIQYPLMWQLKVSFLTVRYVGSNFDCEIPSYPPLFMTAVLNHFHFSMSFSHKGMIWDGRNLGGGESLWRKRRLLKEKSIKTTKTRFDCPHSKSYSEIWKHRQREEDGSAADYINKIGNKAGDFCAPLKRGRAYSKCQKWNRSSSDNKKTLSSTSLLSNGLPLRPN